MDAIKTGGLIAQVRKEKELTQKDLAETLHVSVQAVSKWENGRSCPDIALLEPLAETLELIVTELLSGQRVEEPKEALVRDSLRFGENQLRPKIRRWKWLFIFVTALLLSIILGFGYVWVRDNTRLIPQRKTVVTSIDTTDRDTIMMKALSGGKSSLHLYEVTLADDLAAWTIKLELWTDGTLEQSWQLLGEYYYENWDGEIWSLLPIESASLDSGPVPRHQTLSLALAPEYNSQPGEFGSLDYTVSFGPLLTSDSIEEIPHLTGGMIGWEETEETASVDPEEGLPLLVWSVQGSDFGWHQWDSSRVEGSAFLVFKLYSL